MNQINQRPSTRNKQKEGTYAGLEGDVNIQQVLNQIQLPPIKAGMITRFSYQILVYIVNIIFLLFATGPEYIYMQIKNRIVNDAVELFKKDQKQRGIILIIIVLIDCSLPSSVILVFIIMVFSKATNVYFVWVETCFVFYFCYVLMTGFFATHLTKGMENLPLKDFFKKIFSQKRLRYFRGPLGLGSFYQFVYNKNIEKQVKVQVSKVEKVEETYKTMKAKLDKIADKLQIDQTIMQFSFIEDNLDYAQRDQLLLSKYMSHTAQCQQIQSQVADLHRPQINNYDQFDIYAYRHAIEILWVLYQKTIKDVKKTQSKLNDICILILILGIKIILPSFVIIVYYTSKYNFFYIYVVSLFYIYILLIMYRIIDNSDMKKRSFLLTALNQLVDFYETGEDDEETMKQNTLMTEQFSANEFKQMEDEQDLEVKQDEEFKKAMSSYKLDVTCQLSLETWDNMRRACVLLDSQKTAKNENAYIFLAIYWAFILFILLQVSFTINVFIAENGIFYEPLVILILTTDFFLVLSVFFQRIYYGSAFNENFKKHKDSISNLQGIFYDLDQLQSIYFESSFQTKCEGYKKIVHRINQKASKTTQHRNKNEFIQTNIQVVKRSIKKLKEQIEYDQEHYSHQFLRLMVSDFESQAAKIVFLMLPIIPPIIKALFGQLQNQK